jgi:ribokinase
VRTGFLGVVGHVVVDHLFRVPRLPDRDLTVPILARSDQFGGTAGNVARAAARLGVETALAAAVGEDFPPSYRAALQAEGVDLTDLAVVAGRPTPAAWIFSDPGGNQVTFFDQGSMGDRVAQHVPAHTVRASEVVHLGTGDPAHHERVRRLALREGRRVALDPSQEIHYRYDGEVLRRLLEGATYLFGNEGEIGRCLVLLDLADPEDLLELVEALVVTRGAQGSLLYAPDERWRVPAVPPRRLVDVTGAGDAYRAGFYAGVRHGLDLPRCALAGAAVASFCLEQEGPQTGLPTWEAAWRRASRHETAVQRDG